MRPGPQSDRNPARMTVLSFKRQARPMRGIQPFLSIIVFRLLPCSVK